MATVYYKVSGQILTADEASSAETAFESGGTIPEGYEFKHWSSSSSSDQEVTALNPGGAGVTVTGNATYYPVVGIFDFITFSKSGNNINYSVYDGNNTLAATDSTVSTSPEDVWQIRLAGNVLNNAHGVHIICAQSGISGQSSTDISGTVAENTSGANVDFGVITLGTSSSYEQSWDKAFRITSFDGNDYIIRIQARFVQAMTYLWCYVYKVVSGVSTLVDRSQYNIFYRQVANS